MMAQSYKPGGVFGTESAVTGPLMVYRDRDLSTIKSSSKKFTSLELFDSSGRLVYM
ncbi:hypothetical protein FIC_01950 [Flavobacteriaceae bacterium 3519-10]|nr:hypothetical protein FIC_01950 [Flavobacteriaceae bacterium 3519-10]